MQKDSIQAFMTRRQSKGFMYQHNSTGWAILIAIIMRWYGHGVVNSLCAIYMCWAKFLITVDQLKTASDRSYFNEVYCNNTDV